MSSPADALDPSRARLLLDEVRRRAGAAAGALARARPSRVLAVLIAVQWLSVVALARTVRHAGWIYYQGGDQLWYYTTGWLLAHGHLGDTLVGYLWPVLLAPIALVAGPNVVHAYPAIILIDVLVLLPIGTVALYGIAERIAGRIFAYWTTVLWIALPFVGIEYTNVGYHQRYTELFLPQALGLSAMADFPTLVAALVSAYFTARIVFDEHPSASDALAAGVAAGAAIAIKPSTALFLGGPALALLAARRFRGAALFLAGLAPALVTLTVWKARGLGHLPIAAPFERARVAAGSLLLPLGLGLHLHRYINLDWHQFQLQLDALQEYFWSLRVIEWLPFAGLIALARRSLRAMLLVGGWFGAFVVVKGTYVHASFADASLLRILIPAAPAFVLLVAALPLLFPGMPQRLSPPPPPPPVDSGMRRRRTVLLVATVLGTAVVPLAAIAAVPLDRGQPPRVVTFGHPGDDPPIPAEVAIGLRARASADGAVTLDWSPQGRSGEPVFYHVYRMASGRPDYTCQPLHGVEGCSVALQDVGVTTAPHFVDKPGSGRWIYRVGVAANWLDDPTYGDVYELSSKVVASGSGR
jgi:hypothetical protein